MSAYSYAVQSVCMGLHINPQKPMSAMSRYINLDHIVAGEQAQLDVAYCIWRVCIHLPSSHPDALQCYGYIERYNAIQSQTMHVAHVFSDIVRESWTGSINDDTVLI